MPAPRVGCPSVRTAAVRATAVRIIVHATAATPPPSGLPPVSGSEAVSCGGVVLTVPVLAVTVLTAVVLAVVMLRRERHNAHQASPPASHMHTRACNMRVSGS